MGDHRLAFVVVGLQERRRRESLVCESEFPSKIELRGRVRDVEGTLREATAYRILNTRVQTLSPSGRVNMSGI